MTRAALRLLGLALVTAAVIGCASRYPWYACYPRVDQDGDHVVLCGPIPAPQEAPR